MAASNQEDKRIRRTKRILEQSLMELLEQKPLKDITVRDLTTLADINRGTFYAYYSDIYDFVQKLEDGYFERFVELMNAHGDGTVFRQTRSFLLDMFTFIQNNSKVVRILLGENGDGSFREKLIAVVREKCHADWIADKSEFAGTEKEFDYRYAFVTSGCIGLIREWVSHGCTDSVSEMTDLTEKLIRQGGMST